MAPAQEETCFAADLHAKSNQPENSKIMVLRGNAESTSNVSGVDSFDPTSKFSSCLSGSAGEAQIFTDVALFKSLLTANCQNGSSGHDELQAGTDLVKTLLSSNTVVGNSHDEPQAGTDLIKTLLSGNSHALITPLIFSLANVDTIQPTVNSLPDQSANVREDIAKSIDNQYLVKSLLAHQGNIGGGNGNCDATRFGAKIINSLLSAQGDVNRVQISSLCGKVYFNSSGEEESDYFLQPGGIEFAINKEVKTLPSININSHCGENSPLAAFPGTIRVNYIIRTDSQSSVKSILEINCSQGGGDVADASSFSSTIKSLLASNAQGGGHVADASSFSSTIKSLLASHADTGGDVADASSFSSTIKSLLACNADGGGDVADASNFSSTIKSLLAINSDQGGDVADASSFSSTIKSLLTSNGDGNGTGLNDPTGGEQPDSFLQACGVEFTISMLLSSTAVFQNEWKDHSELLKTLLSARVGVYDIHDSPLITKALSPTARKSATITSMLFSNVDVA